MNLVLTICIGEIYNKIGVLTHPSLKLYADKIGAEFLSISSSNFSSPHWEKFSIYNLLNKYKRILFLDSDIIIREDCPNLFDLVPAKLLGLFNEAPFTDGRVVSMNQACNDYSEIKLFNWNGKYYNTGVMVISRCHKFLFRKPKKEVFNFYEQGYLNLVFAKENPKIFDLSYQFNRMTCMDKFTGEPRHASFIIHYAGFPNLNHVLSLIPGDLEKWSKNKPDFYYQKHIIIDVQGGLGDQVQAEPSIRFMKNNVYPNDDLIIKTHFPFLFRHLDLPVFLHEDFLSNPDTPYFHVISLPGPNMLQWSIISNLLCHTVDYISMSLMRRILPFKDKHLRLQVDFDDINQVIEITGIRNLSELVLVHPGKHWQSKTFPISWWNEVIYGLVDKNVKICLIGMDEDTRGTLDVDVPKSAIDTRNLLDLGGLIALISVARGLISNDSAPIHIAGAFDNQIILIPTCKHPDHVLPWRNGSQTHKATALYKKLVVDDFDSQPTTVHGSSGEFVHGDILDYLPDPCDVISYVATL